ncbi:uncharacterized protein LOC142221757 [Haematobia irritans]|uniref:uncharacterized protein LOC142221757 n=1 Tax=Haematobia irritans TaxID=7368 RepID=UPI003F500449
MKKFSANFLIIFIAIFNPIICASELIHIEGKIGNGNKEQIFRVSEKFESSPHMSIVYSLRYNHGKGQDEESNGKISEPVEHFKHNELVKNDYHIPVASNDPNGKINGNNLLMTPKINGLLPSTSEQYENGDKFQVPNELEVIATLDAVEILRSAVSNLVEPSRIAESVFRLSEISQPPTSLPIQRKPGYFQNNNEQTYDLDDNKIESIPNENVNVLPTNDFGSIATPSDDNTLDYSDLISSIFDLGNGTGYVTYNNTEYEEGSLSSQGNNGEFGEQDHDISDSKNKKDIIGSIYNNSGITYTSNAKRTNSSSTGDTEENKIGHSIDLGDCLKKNGEICMKLQNYPNKSLLEKLITKKYPYLEMFFNDEFLNPENIMPRIEDTEIEESLCPSRVSIYSPDGYRTNLGSWEAVVNTPKYKQVIISEECLDEGEPCRMCSSPNGYKAICKQKYIYRSFLVLKNDTTLTRGEPLKIPSTCACVLKSG